MECKKIKELLSAYADESLSQEDRQAVDGHIRTCKGCADELLSLREYLGRMHSLKAVKAPADFLEKVHEKINKRFDMKNIIDIMFRPARIKLPLEVATLCATLVIGVFIFRHLLPEMGLEVSAPAHRSDMAPEGIVVPPEIKYGESDLSYKIGGMKAAETPGTPQEAAEEAPVSVKPMLSQRTKAAASYDGERAGEKSFSDAETGLGRAMVSAPDVPAPQEEKAAEDSMLVRIRGLIADAGGTIESVEYDKERSLARYIMAEIPLAGYDNFAERLSLFGEVEESAPVKVPDGGEALRVRIRFKR